MNSDFSITISSIVNIKEIQTQLLKEPFKIKVEADTSSLRNINLVGGTASSTGISDTATNATKASNAINDLSTKIKNLVTQNKLAIESSAEFNAELRSIQNQFAKTGDINAFNRAINSLKNNISETSVSFQKQRAEAQKESRDKALLARQINSVTNQYNALIQALKNAHTQGQISDDDFARLTNTSTELFNTYKEGAGEVDRIFTTTENGFKGVRNELSGLKSETASHSQDLDKILVKYLRWYLLAGAVSAVFNGFRSVITQIKNLDAALVELNKVSSLTKGELRDVTDWAFKLGNQVGKTGTQVIEAATEFKRAGYTLEESMALSKTALIMTNVAEGINDAGTAANYLISILKGANLEISYSNKLLDELNEISNTSAVNFDSLANMTQRIAGTMRTLGNSVEETMALVTGAYEVLQDERVAKGVSVIGLRIAGLNEDLEREAGLQSNVNKALMEYAGISIFDSTRQLRDTYDILEDLASVWGGLNKNAQAYLTTTLAGKNRADVLAAILSNWQGVESAMSSAMNSAGSALEEQQAYLDSIQGKQQALANSWQELADTTLNSGVVKFFYDFLNAITKMATAMGGLVPIATTLLGIIIAINSKKIAKKTIEFGTALKSSITLMRTATTTAQGLQAAISGIGLAMSVLSFVVSMINSVTTAIEQRREAEKAAREEAIASADETVSKLEEVKNRYIELSEKTNRTADQEKELLDIQKSLVQNYGVLKEGIDGVNGSYEDYLKLTAEAILQQKKEKLALLGGQYQEAQKTLDESKSYKSKITLSQYGQSLADKNMMKKYFGVDVSGNYWTPFGLSGEYYDKFLNKNITEIYSMLQEEFNRLSSKQLTSSLTEEEANRLTKLTQAIKYYDAVVKDANSTIDEYLKLQDEINNGLKETDDLASKYNEQLDQLKANLGDITNTLEKELELEKKNNEELEKKKKLQDKLLKVEQARAALAEAQNKKIRVYRAGKGFVYESDQSEVQSAQEKLTDALSDLSEYKYELALENAESFVSELAEILSSKDVKTEIVDLINNYGDLLGEGFNKYLDMAKKYVEEFNSIVSEGGLGEPITFSPVPAYAKGTNFAAGGPSLVGENGPELVDLPRGARVYTALETSRMLNNINRAKGSTGTPIQVGTIIINEPNNFDGFVNEFCSQLNIPKPVKLSS